MGVKNAPKNAGGASAGKKSAGKKSAVVTFASLQVARSRAGGASAGGRFNPKTRRLVVPACFAGKKVAVVVHGELLLVGGAGGFACHPTQHFVTLPVGVVASASPVDLAVAELPKIAGVKLPEDAVAYRLPVIAKKSGKKSGKKSPEKSPEKSPADASADASGKA